MACSSTGSLNSIRVFSLGGCPAVLSPILSPDPQYISWRLNDANVGTIPYRECSSKASLKLLIEGYLEIAYKRRRRLPENCSRRVFCCDNIKIPPLFRPEQLRISQSTRKASDKSALRISPSTCPSSPPSSDVSSSIHHLSRPHLSKRKPS